MKVVTLLSLASAVLAVPAVKQAILGGPSVEQWQQGGTQFVKQNDIVYELVSHPNFSAHKLRVQVAKPTLCDPDVKQLSGYLDVDHDKHLFFWQVQYK